MNSLGIGDKTKNNTTFLDENGRSGTPASLMFSGAQPTFEGLLADYKDYESSIEKDLKPLKQGCAEHGKAQKWAESGMRNMETEVIHNSLLHSFFIKISTYIHNCSEILPFCPQQPNMPDRPTPR